jgi:hypothetical protein
MAHGFAGASFLYLASTFLKQQGRAAGLGGGAPCFEKNKDFSSKGRISFFKTF